MKKVLLVVVLFCLPLSALAYTGSGLCSWTTPLTFVDGAPLNPEVDLQGYKIHCGAVSGVYTSNTVISGGTTTSYTIPLNAGYNYCVVTSVTTTTLGALESAYSNEAVKNVIAPVPNSCATFTIN